MIKKLLLGSIVTTLALANTTTADLAMEHYKNKEYAKALEKFEQISSFTASSGVDFYIGRSHYELGNYDQALVAYDRFLINNPQHKRAQLEVAQTYFKLGAYEQALERFQTLMSDPQIPEVVKRNIQLRIGAIKERLTPHNYRMSATFGIGYDTNIHNATDADSYDAFIPGLGTIPLTPQDKEESFFYDAAFTLNHIYTQSDDMALQNSVTLYHRQFKEDSSKTTSMLSLATAPVFKYNGANLMLRLGYDHVWYDSSSYLDVLSITPSFSKPFDDNKLYNVSLKVAKKLFHSDCSSRDATLYELSNRLLIQTKDYGVFGFDLIAAQEQRDNPQRTDISKNQYTLALTNSYNITQSLNLRSSISYSDTKYKYKSPFFLSKRDDERYNYGLNLGYRYNNQITVGTSYNYIKQNSSHAPYDYDKSVIRSYLNYTF